MEQPALLRHVGSTAVSLHVSSGLGWNDACEGLAVAQLSVRGAAADSSAVPVIREAQRANMP
jgi:hypothetical protein